MGEKKDYSFGRDPNSGRFLTGNPGGPGRPAGSRAKFEEKLFKLVTQMVEKNGETFISLAGRPETFGDVMAFIQAASKLVSKQMQVETSSQTDELLALLASQSTNSPITRLKNNEPSVTE